MNNALEVQDSGMFYSSLVIEYEI